MFDTEDLKQQIFSYLYHRQTSNVSRTLVDNKIVDHSDVVEASPLGAVNTWLQWLWHLRFDSDICIF